MVTSNFFFFVYLYGRTINSGIFFKKNLQVSQLWMQHGSIVGDPSPLRQMAGQRHNSLKTVTINGFCSAKSLVEIACYIVENAASLDCLTLDTTLGLFPRCSGMVMESGKTLLAIRSYIKDKVPPAVKLNVLGAL